MVSRPSNQIVKLTRLSRHTSVGLDARFFGKSFETSLQGFFFRSTVVSDKFISRRVDLFFVAYQFPRPSVSSGYVIFVVPTAKMKTAIVAVVTKLNSSMAVVIDPSLFFVCHLVTSTEVESSLSLRRTWRLACQVTTSFPFWAVSRTRLGSR